MYNAKRAAKPFAPERGMAKERLRRCFKEDPFSDGILEEFCEETSMHGFKFLLPRYLPLIRRIFWGCILFAFSIITVYQLVKQINGYLATPLSVNLEKQYPDSVTFPVVYLCNTMPYRVSKIHPKSIMHAALSDIYDTPKLNISASENYKDTLSVIKNTTEYLENVAFSKSNMIVRCMWQNTEACRADDFVTYFVDNRICYAYNTGKNGRDVKTVSQAGESNGLQVILNAETYEEMHGPYTTYGILVGLGAQGTTPSASNTIYTMIGASTKIGIKREEVQYYKGTKCDEKPLKYFSTYSRQACVMEHKIDLVVERCKCFPFVVTEDYIARNNTNKMQKCDLYQHFRCSSRTLDEIPKFDKNECPQECHTVTFSPSVSQSVISWSRTRAQFWEEYTATQNLQESLTMAMETKHRYNPYLNETYKESFDTFRELTVRVEDKMWEVNNLSLHDKHGALQLETPLSSLPVKDTLVEFETEMISEDDGLLPAYVKSLSTMNSTISSLALIMDNNSFASYLFSNSNMSSNKMYKKGFPRKILVISEGSAFLQLLDQWVHALIKLMNRHSHIGIGEQIEQPAWMKILSANDVQDISEIQSEIDLITFEKNVSDQNACMDKTFYNFTDKEGQEQSFSTVEVFTCVLHHWTGPAMKQSMSEILPTILSFMVPELQETGAQSMECQKVLCLVVQGRNTPDCSLSEVTLKSKIKELITIIQPQIENCNQLANNSMLFIDEFVKEYRNSTMAEFYELDKNMTTYREKLELVEEMIHQDIWPVDDVLSEIVGNITEYQYHEANMTGLTGRFTLDWENWESDQLTLSANTAKESLETIVEYIEELLELTDAFDRYINATNRTSIYNAHQGSFHTLSYVYLWGNATETRLNEVRQILRKIENSSKGFIEDIPTVKSAYSNSFQTLLDYAKFFESQLVMDNEFTKRNFLVVQIFFNEVSVDLTIQGPAYTFWSMMSDLGGTCGLWLGFSITTGVEIFSLIFRYFLFPFIRWLVDMLDGDLDLLNNVDLTQSKSKTEENEAKADSKEQSGTAENSVEMDLKDD